MILYSSAQKTVKHYTDTKQKHDDRNTINSVHHAERRGIGPRWVWLLKHPNEVPKHFTHLKKFDETFHIIQ
jgi:hypothetical protein